jgi:short-subunit dehydrogenase
MPPAVDPTVPTAERARPTALITGASSGIGLAFARAYADRGHDLVLVARNREALDRTAAELRARPAAAGASIEVLPADLTTPDGLDGVSARLRAVPVDVVVNNAGFGLGRGLLRSELDDELRLLDLLTRAVLVITKVAVPAMLERGSGQVITVASVAAFLPGGSYAAAKAWAVAFTRGLAHELTGSGVRATVLCPGFVRTDFHPRAQLDMGHLPRFAWIDPDRLVADCLRDVERGRIVSVPSLRYRVVVALLRHAPLRLVDGWLTARRAMRRRRRPARSE